MGMRGAGWMVLSVVLAALLIGTGCPREEAPPVVTEVPPVEEQAPAVEGSEAGATTWTITSSAFAHGETIPQKYTEDGEDISPPLTFEGVPEGTAEIALICHDPDAPREGGWTHWVVYGMAPDIGGLPEGVPPEERVEDPGLIQGENSWGKIGYGGPAPPPGSPHRYQFLGYALSEELSLEPGATKAELEEAMEGKVIGEAMLEGMYGR
ncbi:MAG: YbhB/YbcL family Raf kinase inhibitor-like protein [Armatimonadota bacterium]